jgi:Fe-S cluster assembly iron-binding protein IscA
MLALTEDACHAIEGILEQSEPGAGIRIAPSSQDGPTGGLSMSVAPAPSQDDQVVENDNALLFVDSDASTFLDDKVLDATVSGAEVQFEVLAQS